MEKFNQFMYFVPWGRKEYDANGRRLLPNERQLEEFRLVIDW
jgi:hypothetical protein